MQEKCNSCGADIEYSAGTQTLKCPYCGASNTIARAEDALPDQVQKIIPLSIDRATLENQVYRYIASGDSAPDDMLEVATISLREFHYVPAYRFAIDYEADWTASFGFDRQEPYTAYRTVYRNNSSHQEAYTAYRTVTDWRPVNGDDSGSFSVATYAGSDLHNSDLSPASLVSKVAAAGDATDFNPSFMQGLSAEPFSLSESAAYASLKDEINAGIDEGVQHHKQGDHQKDWRWKAKINHAGATCYAPLCHAAFVYDGREYHFWMGGNGVAHYAASKLPEDKNKKKNRDRGYIPFWAAVAGTVFASIVYGFTWTGIGVVLAAYGYAALRGMALLDYSKAIRQSLLTQMEASSDAVQNLSDSQRAQRASAFQRPKRPFLARTHLDKFMLSGLSVLAFLVICVTGYESQPGHNVPHADNPQIAASTATTPPPGSIAIPQATQPAQAAPQAAASASASGSDKTPIEVASIKVPAEAETVLRAIMDAASNNNWTAVDVEVGKLRQVVPPVPKGDLATARQANSEGLKAFHQSDMPAAINAFSRAVNADLGNVEIRNNLADAYLSDNNPKEALDTVIAVLLTAPDQSPGWANAGNAFAKLGAQDRAVSCLRLALRYSTHRQKILEYWSKAINTESNQQYRAAIGQVLGESDNIPQAGSHAADASPQQVAKHNEASDKPTQTATQSVAVNSAAPAAPQQSDGAGNGTAAQIESLYTSAVGAMRHGQYDRAIEMVDNGLALAPGDTRLQNLKNTLLKTKQQSNPVH